MDEKETRQLIIVIMCSVAAVAGLEAIREGLDYGIGKYNPFRRASGPFGADLAQRQSRRRLLRHVLCRCSPRSRCS